MYSYLVINKKLLIKISTKRTFKITLHSSEYTATKEHVLNSRKEYKFNKCMC